MRIKDVIAKVRAQGLTCTWKSDVQEFRINFKLGTEETAYYTNNGFDAVMTAMTLASLRDRITYEGQE